MIDIETRAEEFRKKVNQDYQYEKDKVLTTQEILDIYSYFNINSKMLEIDGIKENRYNSQLKEFLERKWKLQTR